jgi:hypothetical protein
MLLVLVVLDRDELARPPRGVEPLDDAPVRPRRDGYRAGGHAFGFVGEAMNLVMASMVTRRAVGKTANASLEVVSE